MNAFSHEVAFVIKQYLPEPHASVLNGITWGLPLKKSLQVYDVFMRAGLLHLVVASGANIAILSGTILFFFQRFGKYISLLILTLVIGIYVYIVGFEAPIIRASIMSIFTFVSLMFGRRTISLYVLIFTAICIGVILPNMITSVSFLLSFSASFGILLFGQSIHAEKKRTVISEFIAELRPSLAASLFTAPIIWWHFKQISCIAPISNVLVSFMIAPVMLIGMMLTIFGYIFPFVAKLIQLIAYGMVEYIMIVAEIASRIPFGFIEL